MPKPWSEPLGEQIDRLKTNRLHGLSTREASSRARQQGPNELPASRPRTTAELWISQFQSPLVLVLCFTLLLSIAWRKVPEALILAVIIVADSLIGLVQESRAQQLIGQLHRLLSAQARVIRDSKAQKIPARLLVLGDIVTLQAGDRVPADGRLLEAHDLLIDEGPLTGRSLPVEKRPGLLAPTTDQGSRSNIAHSGTLVIAGTGVMVVIATGRTTELGQASQALGRQADQPERITRQVRQLGLWLLGVGGLVGATIFFIGLAQGQPPERMVGVTASLLVSMVPEALPVTFTIILALGLRSLYRSRAIVRRLASAEALGTVSIIAFDKTGLVTENRLVAETVVVGGEALTIGGGGYALSGHFHQRGERLDVIQKPTHRLLLELCALSSDHVISDADLRRDEVVPLSDAAETALAVVAAKAGFYAAASNSAELTANSRSLKTSTHQLGTLERVVMKGLPTEVLARCRSHLNSQGQSHALLAASRTELLEQAQHLAAAGYQVVAIAYADRPKQAVSQLDQLTFVGFVGLVDPITPGAGATLARIRRAGIRVMILSGDSLLATKHLATKLGLDERQVVDSSELMNHQLSAVTAVANLSPTDKLQIVERLQKAGEVVMMTGDGASDAPALKAAEIGLALGRQGADVAMEAADVVLLSPRLDAVLATVTEGRLIWQNMRKIIYYLVSTSLAEALVVAGALLLGWSLPLVAVQILWMNLVADGLTATALAFEPAEGHLMSGRPSLLSGLVDRSMVRRMALATITMTLLTLLVFHHYQSHLAYARTAALTVLVFCQLFNLLVSRSETVSIFRQKLTSNRALLGLLAAATVLHVLAVYQPFLNRVLGLVPLSVGTLLACVGLALTMLGVDELRKYLVVASHRWARAQKLPEAPVYTESHG